MNALKSAIRKRLKLLELVAARRMPLDEARRQAEVLERRGRLRPRAERSAYGKDGRESNP
jgi:hypothetical protein